MLDAPLVLVIGDHVKSSWSMRPHVGLVEKGVEFEVELVALDRTDSRANLRAASPTGLVPALRHGDLVIGESLAILEYLEERYPPPTYPALLPEDLASRARVRSLAARMHAGWSALRAGMSFEDSFRVPPPAVPEDAAADAHEVLDLFEHELERSGGPFLSGSFGLADCMFAPVCQRFSGFGTDLSRYSRAGVYIREVLERPSVAGWIAAGRAQGPD